MANVQVYSPRLYTSAIINGKPNTAATRSRYAGYSHAGDSTPDDTSSIRGIATNLESCKKIQTCSPMKKKLFPS